MRTDLYAYLNSTTRNKTSVLILSMNINVFIRHEHLMVTPKELLVTSTYEHTL